VIVFVQQEYGNDKWLMDVLQLKTCGQTKHVRYCQPGKCEICQSRHWRRVLDAAAHPIDHTGDHSYRPHSLSNESHNT